MSYANNKKWRKRYPEKWREQKLAYYEKHRTDPQNQRNAGSEWSLADMTLIVAPVRPPDPVLAKLIGRSVEAIQIQRSRLRVKD